MLTQRHYVRTGRVTTAGKEVRFSGVWWTPEDPATRVPGELHISEKGGIQLSLNGSLRANGDEEPFDSPSRHELIVGEGAGGHLTSLYSCSETLYQTPISAGYSTQRLTAEVAFVGLIVDTVEDLEFQHYRLELTHLADWMRNVGVGSPQKKDGGYFIPYDANASTTTPELRITVGDAVITFRSEPTAIERGPGRLRAGVTIHEWVEIDLAQPVSVQSVLRSHVEPIRDFLSLATTRANSVTVLETLISPTDSPGAYAQPVQIHATGPYDRAPAPSLFNQSVILFYAADIAEAPQRFVERWFELEREMRDVCELFFGVHYGQGAFPTNRFLNVVQALESYSRVRHKSLPKNCSLQRRLDRLLTDASPLTRNLAPNAAEFRAWSVDTRNSLTHLDPSKKKVARGEDLELLTFALLWLLRIHFLIEAGFEKSACSRLLANSSEFKMIQQLTLQRAPWASAAS